MFFIRPKRGLIIIDPATDKPLPAEGYWVIKSQYWRRRLKDGEIERVRPGATVDDDPIEIMGPEVEDIFVGPAESEPQIRRKRKAA